jgi:ABC-type nitrate/sulfonate/bicarbonate transport system substrate-binding protein
VRWIPAIVALVAAAALLAGCGGASRERSVTDATLVLDFTPNAAHAGIYSAVAHGYDRAEGVRLHVQVPSSSTDSVKLLLDGRVAFAVMDIHDLALARAKGRDLVAVMALVQRPLAAVLTTPGVRDPKQLQGRRVGVTGVPSDDAVLSSIVAGAGGDPHKVERVTIGFNAVPALLGGRVAGATAFWDVEGVALRERRPGTHEFRVDAYGAPRYPELVLCTSRAELERNLGLVRGTVRALVRGYGLTVRHPAASLADLRRRVSGLDAGELARQLAVLRAAIDPPGGRIGALDPQILHAWAQWETRFGIVPRRPDVARMLATTLVPGRG